jgi:UV DNA damage endonuclease
MSVRLSSRLDLCELCPGALMKADPWHVSHRPNLRQLIPRINTIWRRKGIRPKQHLSSPRPGSVTVMEKRAHARRCSVLPKELEMEGAGWWWSTTGEQE